jgi:hypothetical protein
MRRKLAVIATVVLGLALVAGIAQSPAQETPPGMTRVSPGKSTRVFVMAAFDDACKPIAAPSIQVTTPPRKGSVSFREGQTTTVMSSLSGKCIGERVQGTGVYYTASPDGTGEDAFEITARLATGAVTTRSFKMFISDGL